MDFLKIDSDKIEQISRKGGSNVENRTGQFIARRRKAIGLTQKELADRLGVTNKAVSKWETGVSHS